MNLLITVLQIILICVSIYFGLKTRQELKQMQEDNLRRWLQEDD